MRARTTALTLAIVTFALMVAGAQPALAGAAQDKARKPPPVPAPSAAAGYDVSYPQCGWALPTKPAFGVVGVDGGRVLKANPCLATLIGWARTATDPAPAYYVNTGNPGPRVSSYWPNNQQTPQVCAASYPANDSTACAYDYGWNNARDSFARAGTAAGSAGAPDPATATWWLDVETGNSWESLQYGASSTYLANDAATLQGMVDALHSLGVTTVGAYSTTSQWTQIVGSAKLGGIPVWYAGVGTFSQAQSRCSTAYSFTGGRVMLTQYAANGFDADWRC
jgi:hypothetical protein